MEGQAAKSPSTAQAAFGTVCLESARPLKGRKRWIQSLPPRGRLLVDQGAAEALVLRKSLFAAGIKEVKGKFSMLEPVSVCAMQEPDVVLAVGLTNYSHTDLLRIMGRRSEDIAKLLGVAEVDVVIDRGNMTVSKAKLQAGEEE